MVTALVDNLVANVSRARFFGGPSAAGMREVQDDLWNEAIATVVQCLDQKPEGALQNHLALRMRTIRAVTLELLVDVPCAGELLLWTHRYGSRVRPQMGAISTLAHLILGSDLRSN